MLNIIVAISILLAINALLLIFSVNRNETKTPKTLQEPPPPMTKRVKEKRTAYRAIEPNGTTVFRNIIKMEQKQKREWEPMGEGHNSICQKGKIIQFPLTLRQEGPFKE